ncbi:peptidase c14 caspase catalytic subunit p20 [Colletotrichum incanum]|uniref:Peptidase c14 caspase catalytic subunit p20 n=1 Tax=Colletotrichum incanum TaxID=1573173 RepID=A0A166RWT0_COLIC|nr:peptidase c14 caspase catalytic subunit p20 [Colletotrichum incanum]
MARGQARVKAVNHAIHLHATTHIQRLVDSGELGHDFQPEGNNSVVRVVAAGTTESAFEMQFGPVVKGVLTEALIEALENAKTVGMDISWRVIMSQVRERVVQTCPEQCVELEGPSRRVCFRTVEHRCPEGFFLRWNQDYRGFELGSGGLHGVREGDQYAVMPPNSSRISAGTKIATASVTRVHATVSEVTLKWADGEYQLPNGAQAFLWKRRPRQLCVLATGNDDFVSKFYTMLSRFDSSYIRESSSGEPPLAVVNLANGILSVQDRGGTVLCTWQLTGSLMNDSQVEPLSDCLAVLENMAKAQHVVSLKGQYGNNSLSHMLHVEFGRVDSTGRQPLSQLDRLLTEGDRIYIELTNLTTDTTLHIYPLDVGPDCVTLLCQNLTSGIEIPPDHNYVFGSTIDGSVVGQIVDWPKEAPRNLWLGDTMSKQLVGFTVVMIIADRAIDVQSLESGTRGWERDELDSKGLVTLLTQLSRERDIRDEEERHALRYDVENLHYLLQPWDEDQSPLDSRNSSLGFIERRPTNVSELITAKIGTPVDRVPDHQTIGKNSSVLLPISLKTFTYWLSLTSHAV